MMLGILLLLGLGNTVGSEVNDIQQVNVIQPLKNWMENLPQNVKDKRLNEIFIPGTHDSAANNLLYDKPLGTFKYILGSFAAKNFKFIRKIISAWTLTQDTTIYEQLNMGIRYLDLRITFDVIDRTYYLSHTFNCQEFIPALKQIKQFMDENAQEVVIMDMSADWYHRHSITTGIKTEILELIDYYLGDKLAFPDEHSTFQPLNKMVEKNQRLILYFGNDASREQLWNINNKKIPWDRTDVYKEKIAELRDNLNDMKIDNYSLNGLAFKISSTASTVKNDVKNRLLDPLSLFSVHRSVKTQSSPVRDHFETFVKENIDEIHKSTIFTFDFPTQSVVQKVINLNYFL